MKKISELKYLLIIILILVIGFAYVKNSNQPDVSDQVIEVKNGTVTQEVTVTGKVIAAEDIQMSFEKNGRIDFLPVRVGDKVTRGKILAQLASGDLSAQLRQAQANVKSVESQLLNAQASLDYQRTKLEELKRGSRPEELTIKNTELEKAKQNLSNDLNSIIVELDDAYRLADDAVRNKTAALFTGSKTSSFKLSFSPCDSSVQTQAESARLTSDYELDRWQTEISAMNTISEHTFGPVFISANSHLAIFSNFLIALNTTLTTGCTLNDSSYDTYRASVAVARSNITTASSALNTLEQNIKTQRLTVQQIQNELDLLLSGATKEQIALQESSIRQAEATVESYRAQVEYAKSNVQNVSAQIEKNILRSPIDGIVTQINIKVGEIVSPGATAIAVLSEKNYQVEAFIPEVDVAKILPDNLASLTLDAFGDDVVFEAKILFVDPAETVKDGVPTYKTTFEFIQQDPRVKSGMTANLTVLTSKKEGVLVIPQRAVISLNGDKTVLVLPAGITDTRLAITKAVNVGLRGSDGNIEVTEGLQAGDKVVIKLSK